MSCDIREPFILQAMGKACAYITASKGYLAKADRDYIADQIVTGASAGETNVNRLVARAVGDPAEQILCFTPASGSPGSKRLRE